MVEMPMALLIFILVVAGICALLMMSILIPTAIDAINDTITAIDRLKRTIRRKKRGKSKE